MTAINAAAGSFTPHWLCKLIGSYTARHMREASNESFIAGARFVLEQAEKMASCEICGIRNCPSVQPENEIVYLSDLRALDEDEVGK